VPIHELTVTPVYTRLEVQGRELALIEYFRVVAATPTLTAEINARVAIAAGALGALAASQAANVQSTKQVTCTPGITTDAFVSWECSELRDGGPYNGGSVRIVTSDAFYIDRDQLRPATLATLFAPCADLAQKLAAIEGQHTEGECHVTQLTQPAVMAEGLEFHDEYGRSRCLLPWESLAPLVVRDGPATRLSSDPPDDKPARRSVAWGKAAPRFVAAADDSVTDAATGLVWTAHDNGKDLTWTAATAYAAAYRGGGHTDWRLPTEDELEVLAEPELAHRDLSDCTRGKLDLLITSAIHPSCGIAWSSTTVGKDRAVAFGFISGTSRLARVGEQKNYRALLVRSPAAAMPRTAPPKKP
jgi:hypothetical protein